jgi:hypothetical protein
MPHASTQLSAADSVYVEQMRRAKVTGERRGDRLSRSNGVARQEHGTLALPQNSRTAAQAMRNLVATPPASHASEGRSGGSSHQLDGVTSGSMSSDPPMASSPPGREVADWPPVIDEFISRIGRKRQQRGYTSILDPQLRALCQSTAIWAEKTILFEDAFPPEDEGLNFWDLGHWRKAQEQLGLDHEMDRKCRRTVSS